MFTDYFCTLWGELTGATAPPGPIGTNAEDGSLTGAAAGLFFGVFFFLLGGTKWRAKRSS